ncbi:regulatory protein TetR [Perkinsela sp. CCAP 1560/4]|nr:regulatory protein TetR [Perkinsela sp. CCAP 1560/4]|eukprot:KNH09751.1 regulatory protein TetR [Perkinsela sp. CCAP 1560/4]
MPDECLELLWRKVLELRDSVLEIGREVHAELAKRKNTISRLGDAMYACSNDEKTPIKTENPSNDSDGCDDSSVHSSEKCCIGRDSYAVSVQRGSIVDEIKSLANLQEIAEQFEGTMFPPANLDMRTQLEKGIVSFEITLLDVEKKVEQARQQILYKTIQHSSKIHRNIKRNVHEYQLMHEKYYAECEARQKIVCRKKRELLDRLETCCHGSSAISQIERKVRGLTDEENMIRSFVDQDGEEHRNVLYYINWMEKFTQPENVPRCLSCAFH